MFWCSAKNTSPVHGKQIVGWSRRPVFLSPAGPEIENIRRSHFVVQHYEGELHPEIDAWAYLEGPSADARRAFKITDEPEEG